MLTTLLTLVAAPALAASPAPENDEAPAEAAGELTEVAEPGAEEALELGCADGSQLLADATILAQAEDLEPLTQEQVRWLKPKLARLPQNPRYHRSYAAYTLEPGEVQLGLTTTVGVLPNVQLGSNLVLDGFGVYNGSLQINAVHAGPVDVALIGSRYQLIQDRYTGSFTGVGGVASVQILEPWSLHLGSDYYMLRSSGLVDLDAISPYLSGTVDDAVDQVSSQDGLNDLDIFASVTRVRAATDFRFNRRDSLVLQFSAFVYARLQTELPDLDFIPDIASIQEAVSYDGRVPVSETYITSLAWNMRWKRAELSLGAGLSSVPGAWLMQSTEFSYKLGGKTRIGEYRVRRTWRENKRDLKDWEQPSPDDEVVSVDEPVDEAGGSLVGEGIDPDLKPGLDRD
jgi:hypothetical protein